jgi:predicted TIM-barrel fold metal-dependent hydrolase
VVLGTDLPFDMALREPAAVLAQGFADEVRVRIGSRNPARLFGLGEPPASDLAGR